VAWLVFPVVIAGAVGLMIALLHQGTAPALALVITDAVAATAVIAAERLFPHLPAWNRSHGDLATDAGHALVSGVLGLRLARPLFDAGGVVVAGWLTSVVGTGLWPVGWPLVAQLALALVIGELGNYWFHRWQHEHELLWRFHAVHHSAERLYWLNAARFHPLDLIPLYATWYVPLVALGCPAPVLALFAMFDAVFGMLQHGNVEVRLGPLNWLFSMAEPHRWHHSRTLAEANNNYGSNLLVWDLVFGTFFLPRDRESPAVLGIGDMPAFPRGWLAQVAAPFRWARVRREAAGAAYGSYPSSIIASSSSLIQPRSTAGPPP
jgi:sterol desaturase/sphingolipid hydroxylase (fatty acid hydroxylase superfamily)